MTDHNAKHDIDVLKKYGVVKFVKPIARKRLENIKKLSSDQYVLKSEYEIIKP
jgi:hypothetical protein